jgi:hypothetical protein
VSLKEETEAQESARAAGGKMDSKDSQAPKTPTTPTSTGSDPASDAAARLHRPIMQSMPDTRAQSFDEIYGPPENFLEIEVSPPLPSRLPGGPYDSSAPWKNCAALTRPASLRHV